MIFFNLEKLESEAHNPTKVLAIIKRLTLRRYLPNKQDNFSANKYIGSSFLLNPEALLKDKNVDILYKIQYIRLAGRRDYTSYKLFRATWLDLFCYPEINLNLIRHNPLITIKDQKIYFKYEENK